MIRYRSARTAPGVNPPAWIESDDASRPTLEEDGGRRAARATDGDARPVGSWETEEIASPHSGQKRTDSEMPDPHFGHAVKMRGFYAARSATSARGQRRPGSGESDDDSRATAEGVAAE
jgi:hypothetical protein